VNGSCQSSERVRAARTASEGKFCCTVVKGAALEDQAVAEHHRVSDLVAKVEAGIQVAVAAEVNDSEAAPGRESLRSP